MKRTFNFRYYQDKFGDWNTQRQYLIFWFIPVWILFKNFNKYLDFYPMTSDRIEQESYILSFIKDTIAREKKLMEHKDTYRVVNEDSFKS